VKALEKLTRHLTVVLSLMFLVFLVLDQYNPMMNFVDNDISRWLLFALCVAGVAGGLIGYARRKGEAQK